MSPAHSTNSAANGDVHAALSNAEIDALAERLNFGTTVVVSGLDALTRRVDELAEMLTLETGQRLREEGLLRDSHDNLFKGWVAHSTAISDQVAANERRLSALEETLNEDCGARPHNNGLFERRGNIATRLNKVETDVEELNRWQVEAQQGAK